MKQNKCLFFTLLVIAFMFMVPNIVNAKSISVTKNIYSNNGSTKYIFSGLALDTTHEYEFGLTKTAASQVENWHLITEYTKDTATVDIITTTKDLRDVVNAVDTGYVTIRDKSNSTVVSQAYPVDLKIPYLKVTNFTVLQNGKDFSSLRYQGNNLINVGLRNAGNSTAYFQYQKITDNNIIKSYEDIKAKKGDFTILQKSLTNTVPQQGWSEWTYWNGYDSSGMGGYGYPSDQITAPDSGLYYLWVYFSGNNIKNIYGYILVDNLEAKVALDTISLPKTQNVQLGKTLTLTPTFSPATTTNKIVTWTSSDESVATVDNAGKITPNKLGSTIITVTSQDGNKKATCTVTVVEATKDGSDSNNNQSPNDKQNSDDGDNKKTEGKKDPEENQDPTTAKGSLPYTGAGIGLIISILALAGMGTFAYFRYNGLRDVK